MSECLMQAVRILCAIGVACSRQVPAVTARNVDSFAAAAPAHHVVMLAFSAAPQASLSLRKAAADYSDRITTGRVWVHNQVTPRQTNIQRQAVVPTLLYVPNCMGAQEPAQHDCMTVGLVSYKEVLGFRI